MVAMLTLLAGLFGIAAAAAAKGCSLRIPIVSARITTGVSF